jgi:long-chain fatty acid transport protein
MKKRICTVVFLSVCAFATGAQAAATKNSENGAAGSGMANARVAIEDRPQANYYNPAAMTRLPASAFTLGVTMLELRSTFTASENLPQGVTPSELAAGETVEEDRSPTYLPYFYGVAKVRDNFAVGLGVYTPYATATEWPEEFAGRGIGTKQALVGYAINPNIAWAITPRFSIAGGFSFVQSSLEIERTIRGSIGDASRDIETRLAFDGNGWQGNAALLWQPTDLLALGVSYRTAVRVDMEGEVVFDRPGEFLAGTFPDQDATTTFRFPDSLNAGVGLYPHKHWKVDGEIEFVRHNVARDLRIDLATQRPQPTLVSRTEWENTVAYRLGTEWRGSRWWTFRGGLAWDPSPVPDDQISPLRVDADRFVVALGTSYAWRRHEFSLGLSWQMFSDREVTQTDVAAGAGDFPGTYESDVYVASLSWTFSF